MPRQLTNYLLLVAVVGLVATGLLAWALPLAQAAPLLDLHRALGAALLVLLAWKLPIVRGSLRRRLRRPRVDRSVVLGALAGVALAAALALGLAWTLGLVSFDSFAGYSALNLHVFVGLALLPLAVLHLARRLERLPRPGRLLSRRTLLRAGVLSLASLALWRATEIVAAARVLGRRVTGSKHAGSFTGNAFPYTSWLFDEVPRLDGAAWRLDIGQRSLAYADLRALPQHKVTAVLDCTGGWWTEQVWRGARVVDVLDLAGVTGAREGTVVSVTGHRWTFPIADLREALLATHVGDDVLDPGHGFPVRLVVPGRRGFQWVKWVARIEVS